MLIEHRNKAFLLVASSVLAVLILEMSFRTAHLKGEYHEPRIDTIYAIDGLPCIRAPYGVYTNAIIVSQYDSDPRTYFESHNTIAHKHNSIGWRDDEIASVKTSNSYRILGIGDSYLWGQGVKQKDICLTRLKEYLHTESPNKQIDTINAGVSGFNTSNQRDQLANVGLRYKPDLVIVHYVLNDVEEDLSRNGPKIEFFTEYTRIINSSDWLSEYSYFWSWGRQRILNSIRARRYIHESVSSFKDSSAGWVASKNALSDIKNMCDSVNAKLLVVIFPFYYILDKGYPFRIVHDKVREYCQSNGIDVLDLIESYREYSGPELWVHPSDQHPNEIAHDIAAKAISKHINEKIFGENSTGQ